MAEMGHEDQFPPPTLSARCRLGEATFARMGGKGEDAPIPDLRLMPMASRGCAENGS
jgi:hypothetical protein